MTGAGEPASGALVDQGGQVFDTASFLLRQRFTQVVEAVGAGRYQYIGPGLFELLQPSRAIQPAMSGK